MSVKPNTLFVDNNTLHWQNYSEFCRHKEWFAGWAINLNAAVNGLGYRQYDYVIIGEVLGDGESPLNFVNYIIENKIKIQTIVLTIQNFDLNNKIRQILESNYYDVIEHNGNWYSLVAQ